VRAVRSDKSIIKGLQREHDRLIEMGREVEAELRRVVDVNKRLEAANAAKDAALKECQRLATDRIRTADAAVKADVYAADALMGIAVLARTALSPSAGEGWVPPGLVEEAMNALEWNSDIIIEVMEKSEPAGKGWYKVPPGVLTRLGELETLSRAALDALEKGK